MRAGSVKKNAIMQIDFALEAERQPLGLVVVELLFSKLVTLYLTPVF